MDNCFLIDYMTFTVKSPFMEDSCAVAKISWMIDSLSDISNGFVCRDKFDFLSHGFNSYELAACFGGNRYLIICASDGKGNGDTVMVGFSGLGIKDVGYDTFQNFVKWAYEHGANFTRVDMAFDDYNGCIPLYNLVRTMVAYRSGKPVLQSRFSRENLNLILGCWNDKKYTNITFGSRESTQYLRIYDKRAEQGSKGFEVPDYWYRMEYECRNGLGNAIVEELVRSNFDYNMVFVKYLNRMFRVLSRQPKNQFELKNKKSIPSADWWLKFTQTDCVGFYKRAWRNVERDIDKMISYLECNYGGYLYTLHQVRPKALDGIITWSGQEQALKPKYQRILQGDYDLEF